MNTPAPARAPEMAQHVTLPRLAVLPCPDHAGKHPFHDQRWIVTEGTEIEFGYDPRPGEWSTRNGSLVAMMRDCEPGTAQAIVRAVNSHAELVAALKEFIAISDRLDQSATHDGLANCALIAKARAAIAKATL